MHSVFLPLFTGPQERYKCVQGLLVWSLWEHLLQQKSQPLQVHNNFYEMSIYSFIDHDMISVLHRSVHIGEKSCK